jgi:hypothetical protein
MTHQGSPPRWEVVRDESAPSGQNGVRQSIAPKGLPSRSYGVKHGERMFDVEDQTFTESGKTGLWPKGDSVAYFDDFAVSGK